MSNPFVLNVRTLRRPAGLAPSASRRFRADWTVELRAGSLRVPCKTTDVSSVGACISIEHVPPRGPDLWLIVDQVPPVPVIVAWQKKNRIGLRFLEEQPWILETVEPRLDGKPEPSYTRPRVMEDEPVLMSA